MSMYSCSRAGANAPARKYFKYNFSSNANREISTGLCNALMMAYDSSHGSFALTQAAHCVRARETVAKGNKHTSDCSPPNPEQRLELLQMDLNPNTRPDTHSYNILLFQVRQNLLARSFFLIQMLVDLNRIANAKEFSKT